MQVVIPLAGPDFERKDGTTKAELLLDGQPLLVRALTSRSWWKRGDVSAADCIFVLRDTKVARGFADRCLADWFPGSRTVFISDGTRGAAFSTLAGVALCDPAAVLCVDLADIIYAENFAPVSIFSADPVLGGILPTFRSDSPVYSYALLDNDGRATRTAEKQVISDLASAGTYFFRNPAVFLAAVDHAIRHESEQTYNNSFFLCPLFNGVIASGHDVRTFDVTDIIDVKQATDI